MSQPTVLPSPTNGKNPSQSPTQETLSPGVESEVLPRARRRTFTVEYKRRILQEVDRCAQSGQVGALLRREGLYSSHLTSWRRPRERGELAPQKRGPSAADPAAKEMQRLRRENERLHNRLEKAEAIIEVQKKLSNLLGLACEAAPKGAKK